MTFERNVKPMMLRNINSLLVLAVLVTGTVFYPAFAQAVPTTYIDRTTWETFLTGITPLSEDFESFTVDTYFRTTIVDVGPFTLEKVGTGPDGPGPGGNFIDVVLCEHGSDCISTDHAALFTNLNIDEPKYNTSVEMVFDIPITAWGADFYDSSTKEGTDILLDSGDTLSVPTYGGTAGFFGFILDPGVSVKKLTFKSHIEVASYGEGYDIDNVSWAPVPEPATLLLLASGLVGLGVWRRRKL